MNRFKMDPNLKWMIKINSLMVNPIQFDKLNKDDKCKLDQDKYVLQKIIRSHITGIIVMLLVYGLILGFIDFKSLPIMYDIIVLIFMAMGLLQSIVYFYNVLFESQDYEIYKTLPVKESYIVIAKIISVALASCSAVAPILVVSIASAIRNGRGLMSILGVLDFILIFMVTMFLGAGISTLIGGFNIRKKWRNLFMNLVNMVNIIINVGFVLSMQYMFRDSLMKMMSSRAGVYGPISRLMMSNLWHILALVAVALLLIIIYKPLMRKLLKNIKNYNIIVGDKETNKDRTTKDTKGKKHINNRSASILPVLVKYNISKFSDSSIIMQNLFSVFLPLILVSSSFSSILRDLNFDPSDLRANLVFGLMISVGIGLVASCIPSNIFSIVVSIDREDHDYLKILPLSRKKYFLSKFLAGLIMQLPLICVILGLIEWYIGIRLSIIPICIISLILVVLPIYGSWMLYDIEHRSDKWQNITELNTRLDSVSGFLLILLVFIVFFGLVMLTHTFYKYISYGILFTVWSIILGLLYGFFFMKYRGLRKRLNI